MKQKVIVKVSISDEKSRRKAMKTVVSHSGVVSATLKDKDQIEVVGDGIDSVVLTTLLRKNVGYAELVSVNPIPEKKEGEKKGGGDEKQGEKKDAVTLQPPVIWTQYPYNGVPHFLEVRENNYDPNCSIM